MRNKELKQLFDQEMRQRVEAQGFEREESKAVVRHLSQHQEKGFVIYSSLTEDNVQQTIDQEKERFRKAKQDFEWKVYSYDTPDNLKAYLEESGFQCEEPEALMIMKLECDQRILSEDTSEVVEISDEKGIRDIIALEDTIWGESHVELGMRLLRDKQEEANLLSLFGIYEDNILVSSAWMYLEGEQFTSLWGGATLPEYRGKGHYTKLLAARAKRAFEKNHPYLTVDARPMSQPILEKLGFECLGYSYACHSPEGSHD